QLGIVAQERGDYEQATEFIERSMQIRSEMGDQLGIASALSQLGAVRTLQGNPAAAVSLNAESHRIRRSIGSPDLAIDLQWLARQRDLLGDEEFKRVLGAAIPAPMDGDTSAVIPEGDRRAGG
ncbi:tetratricopeptide repeat protein, partial [Micromonospora rifamycinica]